MCSFESSRAVLAGRYALSEKARDELDAEGLDESDVVESIANARRIHKLLRSTSRARSERREYLYVIQSPNLHGITIYTKGKFVAEEGLETYYFLISSKRAQ